MTQVVEEHRDSLLRKWNLRYGHANMDLIKQMSKDQVVNGLYLTKEVYDLKADCLSCVMAKLKRISFNTHPERSKEPFQKLIVDIGFMSHVNTFDGYSCYLAAIDERARFKWIVLLSDDDSMFNCKKWNLCKTGMRQMLTHAFTPEEISLVEKVNYTIKIKVVAVLKSSGLPDIFWGECLKICCGN